jgi:DNA processing protein
MTPGAAVEDRRLGWLALQRLVDGSVAADAGALRAVIHDVLDGREGSWRQTLAKIAGAGRAEAERELSHAEAAGARLIDVEDGEYPGALRQIPAPPLGLFVRGRIEPVDARAVAVIGSRRATPYGLGVAAKVVPGLAKHQVTVVSGMAIGVDSAAHRSALRAGGRTIAVLGTGIDVCYPRSAQDLYEEIPGAGAVISEAPPGTEVNRSVFGPRNRIIAGISKAVVVAEAGLPSGTMQTANFALDYGREVGAAPGDVDVGRSDGTNKLLAEGAFVVRHAYDVLLHVFKELYADPDVKGPFESPSLDPASQRVFEALGNQPIGLDALIAMTRLPAGALLARLSGLERQGLACRDRLGRYRREGGQVVIRDRCG